MKKNGFTLIELLAVILILGIISLIAIPTVNKIIEQAKEGAAVNSAYGYVNSLENSVISKAMTEGNDLYDYEGSYILNGADLIKEDTSLLTIDGNGISAITGDLILDDIGKVTEGFFTIGKYEVYYNGSEAVINGLASEANVRKIILEKNINMDVDETYSMAYSIYPLNAINGTLTWSSSDNNIATVDQNGKITSISNGNVIIKATSNTNITAEVSVIVSVVPYTPGESILSSSIYDFIKNKKLTTSGQYTIVLPNGESILSEVYVQSNDTTYSVTPTLCDNVADTKMCIYKYTGNLTINSGVTVTPQVRKKGFTLFVGGTLDNAGTISMSERGAIATGENVLLFQNENLTYETVPATGSVGGAKRQAPPSSTIAGFAGTDGSSRKTGGGGGGAARSYSQYGYGGPGGSGTSYSGGAGGGGGAGTSAASRTGGTGSSSGGAGGGGNWMGGGAGNPGGGGSSSGSAGTGGLLIIYSNNINNNGTIWSRGSTGGVATDEKLTGGGGSGGGSINIFYTGTYTNTGSIVATGGAGGTASSGSSGGAGGTGSVSRGSIATGTYIGA